MRRAESIIGRTTSARRELERLREDDDTRQLIAAELDLPGRHSARIIATMDPIQEHQGSGFFFPGTFAEEPRTSRRAGEVGTVDQEPGREAEDAGNAPFDALP